MVSMHDGKCLVNEDNELWKKNAAKKKPYEEVLKKYKGKGIWYIDKGKYTEFAYYLFVIALRLIMKDLIYRNFAFKFPHVNGGYILLGNINYKFKMIDGRKMQEVNVIWIDFLKYISAKRKHSYTMRLNKRWRKIVYAMVYSGHFYPKYKGIHGKK